MTAPVFSPSVNAQEVAHFSSQAQEWWNPEGSFRALHDLMPLRLNYVREQVSSRLSGQAPKPEGLRGADPESSVCGKGGLDSGFNFLSSPVEPKRKSLRKDEYKKCGEDTQQRGLHGLSILDVGCGGGLMAEAMAREGAKVTAIDASEAAIKVAQEHAAQGGLAIDYRESTVEALLKEGKTYDVIVAFEIVEHVANLKSFMKALAALLKPDGVLLIATMNRTKRSFLLGVVAAEYILGWVPAGTHDWDKFVKPSEMVALWQPLGITATDVTGLVYRPFLRKFEFCKGNAAVNYFMAGKKG